MKLWKLSQTQNNGYDTYDSCVVAASTEEIARAVHPATDSTMDGWDRRYKTWANTPADVTVEYIGHTDRDYAEGTIIITSFNAG